MAQTGYSTIQIYGSGTAGNTPSAGNLTNSSLGAEIALNYADGKLYYKDSGGTVQTIASKATGTVAGSTTQVIYNNAGAYAGSANFTFNGTTVTIANDASISGLTVGKGGGAVAGNTAVGLGSLQANTTGNYNTAVGYQAGYLNTTGRIDAFGTYVLQANTTGVSNVGMGGSQIDSISSALRSNTTGSYNTGIGMGALGSNTTASNNTAVGYQAAYSTTTGIGLTAIGDRALYNCAGGQYNAAIGGLAMYANTTGNNNVALGSGGGSTYGALQQNTTGSYNVAIGSESLKSNTTASNNTAVGYQAGYSNTTGTYIAALGYRAGYNITTGGNNTAIGPSAGYYLTTGTDNTYLGNQAGNYNIAHTTGQGCVYIGSNANPSSTSVNYETVIGGNVGAAFTGKGASTSFIAGACYQGNNSTLWSITSDQRLKKNIVDNNVGLEKITQIKVRNFEYRKPEEVTELDPSNAIQIEGLQLGAIAQELKEVLPDCVKTESTGVMSVDASNLTWYLVNAIKELKAEIDQLKGK